MGFIYKVTNQINSKVYIGLTTRTIQERWREHRNTIGRKNTPFYNSMREYGINNFIVEQVEECSNELLGEREIYWIKIYNSFEEGYNLTRGGELVVSKLDKDKIYQMWKDNITINDISKITGHRTESISALLQREWNVTTEEIKRLGYINRAKKIWKKVGQYDKCSNKLIEVYESIQAANLAVPKAYVNHISACCHNKRVTAGGYKWQFYKEV